MQNKTLTLVEQAIFPISFDKLGNRLVNKPQTGFNFPGTVQGEGKLMGIPSLFIRLAGCNLRCMWSLPNGLVSVCDTPYASFEPKKVVEKDVDTILAILEHNLGDIRHLVITGGEPLIQADTLIELLSKVKKRFKLHITIETNGTIWSEEIAQYVDLFSISPKLSNSSPNATKMKEWGGRLSGTYLKHDNERLNVSVIQQVIDFCRVNSERDFQLKFVVGSENDEAEMKRIIAQLNQISPSDVLVMPLGGNHHDLQLTNNLALSVAIRNGWRFSPRLHIEYLGNQPGV